MRTIRCGNRRRGSNPRKPPRVDGPASPLQPLRTGGEWSQTSFHGSGGPIVHRGPVVPVAGEDALIHRVAFLGGERARELSGSLSRGSSTATRTAARVACSLPPSRTTFPRFRAVH